MNISNNSGVVEHARAVDSTHITLGELEILVGLLGYGYAQEELADICVRYCGDDRGRRIAEFFTARDAGKRLVSALQAALDKESKDDDRQEPLPVTTAIPAGTSEVTVPVNESLPSGLVENLSLADIDIVIDVIKAELLQLRQGGALDLKSVLALRETIDGKIEKALGVEKTTGWIEWATTRLVDIKELGTEFLKGLGVDPAAPRTVVAESNELSNQVAKFEEKFGRHRRNKQRKSLVD